jgi:AGCS family alanine or glycine:cation symporter
VQGGIDATLDAWLRPVADAVAGVVFLAVPVGGAELPLIVAWLVAGGVFFTVYLRGLNLRGFAHAVRVLSGRSPDTPRTPDGTGTDTRPGDIPQYRALTTAVSGTVGIGNIAGVAVAISVGGPGATFWLIVAGLLGMATKFAECTLAVRYRHFGPDGSVVGGPMLYLTTGLRELGRPVLGRSLGLFYAGAMVVGCLGIGNMFQSNQAVAILVDVTGGAASPFAERTWVPGLILAVVVAVVIVGGIRSIAATTARLVPGMALLYGVCALAILALNAAEIPAAIVAIVRGAFAPEGVAGGVLGVMVFGFRRAVFSNEAGLGSASIAHATAQTHHPASEGFVGLLEPFIDTVVICTLTALVIVTTVYEPGTAGAGVDGIELTRRAFSSTIPGSSVPLAVAAILFAFSTMITWSFYGLQAFRHLFGTGPVRETGFKLAFCAFVVLGSSIDLAAVVDLSDALVFLVAIPNLIGLYLMAPVVRRELAEYRAHLARDGHRVP